MAKRAKPTTPVTPTPTQGTTKMAANFSDVLNKKLDTIEKPKPLPVGTYIGVINGAPEIKPRGQNNTLSAEFKIKILQADEDVDQDALQERGGIKEAELRHTLWLTEDAAWRAKQFVEFCGVDPDGITLGEALSQCMGCQLRLKIIHRPSQDGTELYANIDKIAAV